MFEMTQLLTVFKKLFSEKSYGDTVEEYIISRHPKNAADVENLTREFQLKQSRNGGVQWL